MKLEFRTQSKTWSKGGIKQSSGSTTEEKVAKRATPQNVDTYADIQHSDQLPLLLVSDQIARQSWTNTQNAVTKPNNLAPSTKLGSVNFHHKTLRKTDKQHRNHRLRTSQRIKIPKSFKIYKSQPNTLNSE